MSDPTEAIRRDMLATGQVLRDEDTDTGPRWNPEALQRDFEVLGFQAPFVIVRRRSDGAMGSLEFTHSPRIYFGWREES